ncbi:hypothetical protein [Pseudomonas sp. 1 R 17]|uniref:hypothetical protein n=1 Tax=Pseudomonas sp. 1 R 17 TaxID=1844091 RepID=UPI000812355C|nr:hypothetical protein [Pseudomonas sp. 1 R 17]SAM35752.1 hypothetical protein BN1864_LIB5394:05799 [Pseudomonas sp. 1 R 17]
MDFPKSVPSVGLVDGKFIDEDAVAGTPGSLIPSAWGNAVTQEILKVIQEAGLEPDEDDNTQLNAAIDQKISGASVAFASQPEAEAGESETKAMSPLRVFQAIAKVVTQATESAFGWLKIATQPQVNAGSDDTAAVTSKKLSTALQNQATQAFTTSGTGTALTLTPSPAIPAYAAKQRFSVTFHVDSGADPTLNVSAKGAKLLKQYSASGAKVAAVFFAGQVGDVVYDGTDCVLLDQLPTTTNNLVGIAGSAKNLRVSTTGTSAVVTVSADELEVESTANAYTTLRAVAVAPSFATAGVDGLDVGAANSQTASTWYAVWVIWNGTTKAGLLSLSGTAPTLPAGYTHAARVAWVKTDSTANKYPISYIQYGKYAQYKVATGSNLPALPLIASGIQGAINTPTYVPVSVSALVPPTACKICIVATTGTGTGTLLVAPNNSFGASNSATNPPPLVVGQSGTGTTNTGFISMALESGSVYVAQQTSTNFTQVFGWEDGL